MCGIAGFWNLNTAPADERIVRDMGAALAHRGPDDEGFLCTKDVALAHRRLAIIDIGGGAQPMTSVDGRLTLVYNGEIYNYRELRQGLAYPFTTRSDTETLLAILREKGLDGTRVLAGMYAYAVWDKEQETLTLGRDPVGIKPLYVYDKDGLFVFASELSALLRHPDVDTSLRPESLPFYFSYLFIPAPFTIYRHIRQLMPGEILVRTRGRSNSLDFTYPMPATDLEATEAEILEDLESVLARAVCRHLISDVPVGVFLSGGIDSSLVAAFMRQQGAPLQAFTIGFPVAEYDEAPAAREVAKHLELDFQSRLLEMADITSLRVIIEHFGEPFADASALPTYILSELAARQVKVVLSGEGGDELFAGYTHYRGVEWSENYKHRVPSPVRRLIRHFASLIPAMPVSTWNYRLQRIRRVLHAVEFDPLRARVAKLAILNEQELADLFSDDFRDTLRHTDLALQMETIWHAADSDDYLKCLGEIDLKYYLPNDMLTKVDRMSMAHGLEVRVPLLDPEVFNFARRIPPSLKLKHHITKFPLRKIAQKYLPSHIVNRRKRGFNVPLSDWFRAGLSEYADDILTDRKLIPETIFNHAKIARMIQLHASGKRDFGNILWALLVFGLWRGLSSEDSPTPFEPRH